jgi:hypothetical protein
MLAGMVVLLAAACSSPEEQVVLPEPEEVETCDGLVDAGVTYVEAMVEALPGQPVEVVTGEAPMPDRLVEVTRVGRELDARAANLECDAAALNAEIASEIGDFASDEPVVQIFLDLVREGVIATLPPPTTEQPVTDS